MAWRSSVARVSLVAISAVLAMLSASRSDAAPTFGVGLLSLTLIETVACRNVRDRLVLPNGRVEYVTRQECTPGAASTGSGCRVIRERVIRPDGSVAFLSRTQC